MTRLQYVKRILGPRNEDQLDKVVEHYSAAHDAGYLSGPSTMEFEEDFRTCFFFNLFSHRYAVMTRRQWMTEEAQSNDCNFSEKLMWEVYKLFNLTLPMTLEFARKFAELEERGLFDPENPENIKPNYTPVGYKAKSAKGGAKR